MQPIRKSAKPISIFLTLLMLSISVPFDSVTAAMIGTESSLDLKRAQQAREEINHLISRRNVHDALMAHGIDPLEAKARIDCLSDAEVIKIADEIDKLPAGGFGPITPPVWIVVVAIVGIVLIIYLASSAVFPQVEVEKKSE